MKLWAAVPAIKTQGGSLFVSLIFQWSGVCLQKGEEACRGDDDKHIACTDNNVSGGLQKGRKIVNSLLIMKVLVYNKVIS